MPLHPPSRLPWQTLAEDREAILLADKLGFCEAYVGEHTTDKADALLHMLNKRGLTLGEVAAIGDDVNDVSGAHLV